ncbi:MAG TPA: FadR/GntR family transcriptional regulator [Acetobacteraceae bacterium]|nr:FadR/GntR family transcriptional regulator [Acetobacteraceae bacterium]
MRTRRTENLCDAVAGELGRRIVAGEIAPGQPVPTQAELCEQLRVSRTTVREAMMRLQGKGLVEARPRDGVRVLPTPRWNQFDADVLAWRTATGRVDPDLLDQLYEIRTCFEPRACALAAERSDDAGREAIRAQFVVIVDPSSSSARRIQADLAFHLEIFAATRNIFFVSLGAAIKTALAMSFRISQNRAGISGTEIRLHGSVCEAILAGDAPRAEASMHALLHESKETARHAAKSKGLERDDRTVAARARSASGDIRPAYERLVLRRPTDR